MTTCRVSEDELANDKGDEVKARVSAVDFRHEDEYAERFFDEIVNDADTIIAVIDLVRNPTVENIAELRVRAIRLSENAARELSE